MFSINRIRSSYAAAAISALVLGTGLCQALPARADTSVNGVVYDEHGMPRCMETSDGRNALVFFWDERTSYPKGVFAATISDIQQRLNPTLSANEDGSGYYFACRDWRLYKATFSLTNAATRQAWTLNPNSGPRGFTSGPYVFRWGTEVEARLDQVRLGANYAHPGATAAEFLTLYPVREFTREYNRQLTFAYGMGFSAEVYKQWLLRQPGNSELRTRIDTAIRQIQARGPSALARRLRGYKILIAQGYMQSPSLNRLEPLIQNLQSLGADVTLMTGDTVGPITPNALSFKTQVARELERGSKIILISASKGAPELLTALGELAHEMPQSMRQITAVLTMAAMVDGSFLVDWADHFPINLFIRSALESGAQEANLPLTSLEGFFDMSSARLAKQSEIYRPLLPDLRYYNFVGAITGSGIAGDRDIRTLQMSLSIPQIGSHGGNDGYIEYPGTRFPRSWGLKSRDIVFDSSHVIMDGNYNGLSMSDPQERNFVIDGIFQAILDDAQSVR